MKKIWSCITGFTLIEMLAVMFIIGIIFCITLPAFGPMMKVMQVDTAAENLANTLESARQCAVTYGVNCYVIFPEDANNKYTSCKIMKEDGSNKITVGKWEFFPKSVAIDPSCSFLNTAFSDPSDPGTMPSATITVNLPEDAGLNSTPTAVRYIKFKPNGAATLNRTIRLISSNYKKDIIFYNQPIPVKVQ